jgi:hypothetical protein
MFYGASHRAGQLGENGPPWPLGPFYLLHLAGHECTPKRAPEPRPDPELLSEDLETEQVMTNAPLVQRSHAWV